MSTADDEDTAISMAWFTAITEKPAEHYQDRKDGLAVEIEYSASPEPTQTRSDEVASMGLLSRLPGELRNRIYRLILVLPPPEEKWVYIRTSYNGPWPTGSPTPPLLQTCKRIRAEVSPIHYGENIFVFEAKVFDTAAIKWLRAIGDHGKALEHVKFQVKKPSSPRSIHDPYIIEVNLSRHDDQQWSLVSHLVVTVDTYVRRVRRCFYRLEEQFGRGDVQEALIALIESREMKELMRYYLGEFDAQRRGW